MNDGCRLDEELQKRASAIAYGISRNLAERCPAKAIVEARNEWFDAQEFAAAGHCVLASKPEFHSQIETLWTGPGDRLARRDYASWFAVSWRSHALEVVTATWHQFPQDVRWQWIIADDRAVAEAFFDAVCGWCHVPRGEVLVFAEGNWRKDAELYQAIAATDFDSLVLHGGLKEEIRTDFDQFLASRATYEQYGVPWKRGVLLLGPPGNGKTHCVKALVRALNIPCLYVKSFKACFGDEASGIRDVFQRARKSTPCLLVLEDIDALVAPESRSFFLNELDGFAANTGIVTVATSNHPERLDPSILERPSRFDRKYYFGLRGRPNAWHTSRSGTTASPPSCARPRPPRRALGSASQRAAKGLYSEILATARSSGRRPNRKPAREFRAPSFCSCPELAPRKELAGAAIAGVVAIGNMGC